MSANLNLLNALKSKMVDFANKEGINLAAHFDTPEKFKEFVMIFAIKQVMVMGNLKLEDAYDLVLGEGAYRALSDSVWNTLNGVKS